MTQKGVGKRERERERERELGCFKIDIFFILKIDAIKRLRGTPDQKQFIL